MGAPISLGPGYSLSTCKLRGSICAHRKQPLAKVTNKKLDERSPCSPSKRAGFWIVQFHDDSTKEVPSFAKIVASSWEFSSVGNLQCVSTIGATECKICIFLYTNCQRSLTGTSPKITWLSLGTLFNHLFFSDPKEEIGVDFSEIEVVLLVWVYVKIVLSNF